MRLRQAIAEADGLRPNAIGEETKAEWIEQLESRFAEVQQIKPPPPSHPEDKELLMPPPVDRVYVLWLAAMIDWAQLDGDLYAVDNAMYTQAYKEACAWWRRHNIPIINADGSRYEP